MRFIDRVREILPGENEPMRYQCASCGEEFQTARERCPECGEENIRERGSFEFRPEGDG